MERKDCPGADAGNAASGADNQTAVRSADVKKPVPVEAAKTATDAAKREHLIRQLKYAAKELAILPGFKTKSGSWAKRRRGWNRGGLPSLSSVHSAPENLLCQRLNREEIAPVFAQSDNCGH